MNNSQLVFTLRRHFPLIGGAAVFFVLFLISFSNYLLFFSVSLAFNIIISFAIFTVVWNSRRFLENKYLLFIGISYLFVGILDFLYFFIHQKIILVTLPGINMSDQVLALARYLQGASFLIAPFLYKRHISSYIILVSYSITTAFTVILIFLFNFYFGFMVFGGDVSYLNRINSFIVSLLFIASIYFLKKNKGIFEAKVYKLIDASLFILIIKEVAFIFSNVAYIQQYSIGIFLESISFYLIYRAIVEAGFNKPYHFLFREFKYTQERYKHLVENSPEAIIVYNKGIIIYVNKAGLSLFGEITAADMLGKKILDFIHPSSREITKQYARMLKAGGDANLMKEFKIVRLDGSERHVEAAAGEIVYEGKKATQFMIRDITERKKKEAELKQNNDFNKALLSTIPFPISIVDSESNLMHFNDKYHELFSHAAVGKKCWESYEIKKQCANCPLKDGLEAGEVCRAESNNVISDKIFNIDHIGMVFQGKKAVMEIFLDISQQKNYERDIQEERFYAESIVNTVRDPLVVLDENSTIVSANWAFYYTFRFLRERTEGKNFYNIYNNYWNIPVLKEKLENAVKNNYAIHNLEINHFFPEIGNRTILLNVRRIYQTNRNDQRFLLSIRDITKSKNSEEQLRQSEEKYRNIFNHASDAIISIDLDDRITSWNKSAEAMFGWSGDEIIGKKFGKLIVPKSVGAQRRFILSSAFSGRKLTGIETIRLRKDGSKINVSMTTSPIYNEKREIVGLSGIIRDITLRKQDEKKLRIHTTKLERLTNDMVKFQLAVEHASDLIIISDKDGVVLYANKAASKITGYSKRDIIGGKAGFFWGKEMSKKFYENFWNVIKNEKRIFVGEVINKRKNGEKYYAEIKVSPIIDDTGNIIFFVGLERDITREKEIDKAKTEFVSIASHELRTPLANMSLTVEMILGSIAGPLNPEQKKYLKGLYRDIEGMSNLVDALLNVSRIELRTLVVAPELTNLKEITENVLKEVAPIINKKGLHVSTRFDEVLPIIKIDRSLMRIILRNLLSNAIKYTPSGGRIGIEVFKNKKHILIKVFDNGCGIPKDQQKKLFQKLFRARNAVDQKIEGVGLGLYIVKSIVVQCGGNIWVESKENEGTDFFVSIPLEGMKKSNFIEKPKINA